MFTLLKELSYGRDSLSSIIRKPSSSSGTANSVVKLDRRRSWTHDIFSFLEVGVFGRLERIPGRSIGGCSLWFVEFGFTYLCKRTLPFYNRLETYFFPSVIYKGI